MLMLRVGVRRITHKSAGCPQNAYPKALFHSSLPTIVTLRTMISNSISEALPAPYLSQEIYSEIFLRNPIKGRLFGIPLDPKALDPKPWTPRP